MDHAAMYGHIDIVRLLSDHGAKLDTQNEARLPPRAAPSNKISNTFEPASIMTVYSTHYINAFTALQASSIITL